MYMHMRAWVDMSVRVCADVHMCMLESIEYFLEIIRSISCFSYVLMISLEC